jgi:hypothetical protein
VFDYIEPIYNPTRRHSTLGYGNPIEFEYPMMRPDPGIAFEAARFNARLVIEV